MGCYSGSGGLVGSKGDWLWDATLGLECLVGSKGDWLWGATLGLEGLVGSKGDWLWDATLGLGGLVGSKGDGPLHCCTCACRGEPFAPGESTRAGPSEPG